MKKFIPLVFTLVVIIFLASSTPERKEGYIYWHSFDTDNGQVVLQLPEELVDYAGIPLPAHYLANSTPGISPFGNLLVTVPDLTNPGATLGRVLFYDKNLSINRSLSCGSCHQQQYGFADPHPFSEGFQGLLGTRNALNIADIGLNPYPSLLWDERSTVLSHMAILPFQNGLEMGITMDEIVERIEDIAYYPELFTAAFGSADITEERIGDALGQFIRTIRPVNTKLDEGIQNNFTNFSEQEIQGKSIFESHCQNCHTGIITRPEGFTTSFSNGNIITFPPTGIFGGALVGPHNTGLDMVYSDAGLQNISGNPADNGKFKTPSLKNVGKSAPYMHDGRFATLEEVVDFYSEGIAPNANSTFNTSDQYTTVFPQPFTGFGFTPQEKAALVVFLRTMTDYDFLTDERWADPFIEESISSGIDNQVSNGIQIAPNPMIESAVISFNNESSELSFIEVMDLSGRLLWSDRAQGNQYILNRGELAAGNYLVRITQNNASKTEKLLIQ